MKLKTQELLSTRYVEKRKRESTIIISGRKQREGRKKTSRVQGGGKRTREKREKLEARDNSLGIGE